MGRRWGRVKAVKEELMQVFLCKHLLSHPLFAGYSLLLFPSLLFHLPFLYLHLRAAASVSGKDECQALTAAWNQRYGKRGGGKRRANSKEQTTIEVSGMGWRSM